MITVPHGEEEVIAFFGLPARDHAGHITESWLSTHFTYLETPFPLYLSWAPAQQVTHIRCHVKVAEPLQQALVDVKSVGLAQYMGQAYGGCFNDRAQVGSKEKVSMHAFGAALDFRVLTNKRGTPGEVEMRQVVVPIFKRYGWFWGGDFSTTVDPMHFQWATGY